VSQWIETLISHDQKLIALFEEKEVDSELLLSLIDERDHILQEIIVASKSKPDFGRSPEWQEAVLRTKQIVELVQLETSQLGEQLKKFRHGNKSVKRYQQFLKR
jgi:flagellar rod protein FlaI